MYGDMAFGGAGVFLSRPLAETVAGMVEECLDTASITSGDGILRDCVGRISQQSSRKIPLTYLHGLYQLDIHNDASGFFEADPQPLLSVHHWKSWFRDPIDQMAAVTRWCGSCFLQRWRFGGDTVLTNGYSIAVYTSPSWWTRSRDMRLNRKEATWRDGTNGDFDYVLGPLRKPVAPGNKVQFKLARAGTVEWGKEGTRFVQTYVYRAREGGKDEVVDLIWA
jgi:hypothetical protein